MPVDELLNPPEETVLKEHPTDEDICLVDTNSKNKTKSELSSANAIGRKSKIPTPTPENIFSEELKERLKWMAELFVSADPEKLLGFN
ncbi:hypothetical protein PI124_g16226 [Phytophthora idaei]|nr:hypothetical protein PI125_g16254 [Phytophthora idaei]KAG3142654.1 hypothetical protein PI126_g14953 [Phytophthora idaei]KAG3238825.1 hypothetical protein PI124_g16226 [Phytophthora idaei]